MKNILIVGGAGYVGGYLVDQLLKRTKYKLKYTIFYYTKKNISKNVPFIYGDVTDKTRLKEQLKWADCVIWLAAIVGDGACEINKRFNNKS